jgi:hypothetical protein
MFTQIVDKLQTDDDTWIVYEIAPTSLARQLTDFKVENRISKHVELTHKEFYQVIQNNPRRISPLIREVAKAI